MKQTVTYRTKLIQVDGNLKATVIAKDLESGVAVVSRPLDSETEAKAEAQMKLAQNLTNLSHQTNAYTEERKDNHAVESL